MELQDLQETAALARLNLGEAELAGAFPAFEQMLGYFAAMQDAICDEAAFGTPDAADTAHTEGMTASAKLVNAAYFRADTANPNPGENPGEVLVAKAGERDGPFIVIPNVL
jgi:aspartyl-tRNA(Asn)/glutamyl-tRNA(Gln) amidotransferase subunit C